jgi:transposase
MRASTAPRLGRGTHGIDQSAAWPAHRVRGGSAAVASEATAGIGTLPGSRRPPLATDGTPARRRSADRARSIGEAHGGLRRADYRASRSKRGGARLQSIAGVGPITAAAIVASVGEPQDFRNGRQFAPWLGLIPKQHSSGGKTRLGRITKRGDAYLRTLLILGAKSTLQSARRGDIACSGGSSPCSAASAITRH